MNDKFASQLDATDNVTIPEETFREHDSYDKTFRSTARHNDQINSTKYCTNNSFTDNGSQLPEGVQQLKVPNNYFGIESLQGSSVQHNINEAITKANFIDNPLLFNATLPNTER